LYERKQQKATLKANLCEIVCLVRAYEDLTIIHKTCNTDQKILINFGKEKETRTSAKIKRNSIN